MTRFALEPAMRRRASILIDMSVDSEPPTRPASPVSKAPNGVNGLPPVTETVTDENDVLARKAGIGNLMKSAKQNVAVPEFDMSAFF